MNNKINKFVNALKRNKSAIIYFAINAFFIILLSILITNSSTYPFFANLIDVEHSSIELIITSQISIATIMVTVELTVKQLFFRSKNQHLFSHTARIVITIALFIGIFSCVIFSTNRPQLRMFAFFYSIVFTLVSLLFFAIDLSKLTISDVIKKEVNKISRLMKQNKSIGDKFIVLNNMRDDALSVSDTTTFETISNHLFKMLDNYLSSKPDLNNPDAQRTINEFLKIISNFTSIQYSSIEGGKVNYFTKTAIKYKCRLIDLTSKFGYVDLLQFAIDDFKNLFKAIPCKDDYVEYVVDRMLEKDDDIFKIKINILYDVLIYDCRNNAIKCDYLFSAIVKRVGEIENAKRFFDLPMFLKQLSFYLRDHDFDRYVLYDLLSNLWILLADRESKELILDAVSAMSNSTFKIVGFFEEQFRGVQLFLDKIKNDGSFDKSVIYEIDLKNCLVTLSEPQWQLTILSIDSDVFFELYDSYRNYFGLCCKAPEDLSLVYLNKLIEFGGTVFEVEKQKKVIDLIKESLIALITLSKAEQTKYLIQSLIVIVKKWNDAKAFSCETCDYLSNALSGISSVYIQFNGGSLDDTFFVLFYTLAFCESASSSPKMLLSLSSNIYKIAVLAIPNHNSQLIGQCSSLISACLSLLCSLNEFDIFVENYKNIAHALFEKCIYFKSNDSVLINVSSIFTDGLSQCLKSNYILFNRFADEQINKTLSNKELEIIFRSAKLANVNGEYDELLNLIQIRLKGAKV